MAPPSPYSAELKAKVLAYYTEHGVAAASREFDVPQGTIAAWANRKGMQTFAISNTQQMVAMRKAQLELQRDTILVGWGELTERSQRRAMEAEKPEEVYKLTLSAAIGTDKLELMTGRATSRHEQGDTEINRELRRWIDRAERGSRGGDTDSPDAIEVGTSELGSHSN